MEYKLEDFTIITDSIKGIRRNHNQDDTQIIETNSCVIAILFDGVSSISTSIDFIQECKKYISDNYGKYINSQRIELSKLIIDANTWSLKKKTNGKTTCSAVVLLKKNTFFHYINIGDSRIYEYTNQFVEPITNDDSLYLNSNILTKSLGYYIDQKDLKQYAKESNNDLILCSDGFYNQMEVKLKNFFYILGLKRNVSIYNGLRKIQENQNYDDSTYIIIKRHGI